jgi:hypothetical protein
MLTLCRGECSPSFAYLSRSTLLYNCEMRQFVMVSLGFFLGSLMYDLLRYPSDIEWDRAIFVGMFVGACYVIIPKLARTE